MWTLHISCFEHNLMPCHVELFKQAIQQNYSDQSRLIQYNYKSSCKHNLFFSKVLLVNNLKI